MKFLQAHTRGNQMVTQSIGKWMLCLLAASLMVPTVSFAKITQKDLDRKQKEVDALKADRKDAEKVAEKIKASEGNVQGIADLRQTCNTACSSKAPECSAVLATLKINGDDDGTSAISANSALCVKLWDLDNRPDPRNNNQPSGVVSINGGGACLQGPAEGCELVKRREDYATAQAKVADLNQQIKDAEAAQAALQDKFDNCDDCNGNGQLTMGPFGQISSRAPTTAENIATIMSAASPLLLGGINAYTYAHSQSQYYGAYNNYLQQCTTIGIPCNGPGYAGGMGGTGIAIGGAGLGGYGFSGTMGLGAYGGGAFAGIGAGIGIGGIGGGYGGYPAYGGGFSPIGAGIGIGIGGIPMGGLASGYPAYGGGFSPYGAGIGIGALAAGGLLGGGGYPGGAFSSYAAGMGVIPTAYSAGFSPYGVGVGMADGIAPVGAGFSAYGSFSAMGGGFSPVGAGYASYPMSYGIAAGGYAPYGVGFAAGSGGAFSGGGSFAASTYSGAFSGAGFTSVTGGFAPGGAFAAGGGAFTAAGGGFGAAGYSGGAFSASNYYNPYLSGGAGASLYQLSANSSALQAARASQASSDAMIAQQQVYEAQMRYGQAATGAAAYSSYSAYNPSSFYSVPYGYGTGGVGFSLGLGVPSTTLSSSGAGGRTF